MTETELNVNKSRSALSTTRQVIRARYSGADVVYTKVQREHIQAVVRRYPSSISQRFMQDIQGYREYACVKSLLEDNPKHTEAIESENTH